MTVEGNHLDIVYLGPVSFLVSYGGKEGKMSPYSTGKEGKITSTREKNVKGKNTSTREKNVKHSVTV